MKSLNESLRAENAELNETLKREPKQKTKVWLWEIRDSHVHYRTVNWQSESDALTNLPNWTKVPGSEMEI